MGDFPEYVAMIKKIIISCLILSIISSKLCAEHRCSTSISYVWIKGEAQNEVPFKKIEVMGKDEEDAKEKLNLVSFQEKKHAYEVCKLEHQNYSACLATKLKTVSTSNINISFNSKALIEEAIKKDCDAISGLCKETKMEEVVCKEIKKEEALEEQAEEKTKDSKKKKKK